MTSRTQIVLAREDHRRAREKAAQLGISLSEYMRRLVARDLERPKRRVDRTAVFALGRSGGSDVARDKHDMVAEAFAARRARDRG